MTNAKVISFVPSLNFGCVKCKSFLPNYKPIETIGIPAEMTEPEHGELATFKLNILFRQNASWQGTVKLIESRQEQTFSSALELVMLMDSALTYTSGLNSEPHFYKP